MAIPRGLARFFGCYSCRGRSTTRGAAALHSALRLLAGTLMKRAQQPFLNEHLGTWIPFRFLACRPWQAAQVLVVQEQGFS